MSPVVGSHQWKAFLWLQMSVSDYSDGGFSGGDYSGGDGIGGIGGSAGNDADANAAGIDGCTR